jgi:diacylglycerol kinase
MRVARDIRKLTQSFLYAIHGLRACMHTERNFRIHVTAAVYVTLFAVLGQVGAVSGAILCLCFALMMASELLNTALERLCDRTSNGYDPLVGEAKDIAAAGVFICALFCVVIGVLLFLPGGALGRAFTFFRTHPAAAALLLLSIPLALRFVFAFGAGKYETGT